MERVYKCYSCNRTICEKTDLSEGECEAHNEHIIPAAIGGHITSRTILCKECGNKQNQKCDSGFTGLFAPFVELLRKTNKLRSFDHKSNNSLKVKGILEQDVQTTKEIKYQDGKVAPLRPFHTIDDEGKIVHLYGDRKAIKNARKEAENYFCKNGKDINDYKIENHDDMSCDGLWGLYFSEGVKDFNKNFKIGMLKIGVEYALDKGINPELMNNALIENEDGSFDFNNQNGVVIPFFPLTKADEWYEEKIDDLDKRYPFHALRLFNFKNQLYCYVELFSTFKYFVLLSDKYNGKRVDEAYAEPLLQVDPGYNTQDLEGLSYKDLILFFQEENLDRKAWSRVVNAESQSKILKELLDKRPKEFDYLQSICNIYHAYFQSRSERVLIQYLENNESPSMAIESIPDVCTGCGSGENVYIRRVYWNNEGVSFPYPLKCFEYYEKNKERVRSYTCAAFNKFKLFIVRKISDKS